MKYQQANNQDEIPALAPDCNYNHIQQIKNGNTHVQSTITINPQSFVFGFSLCFDVSAKENVEAHKENQDLQRQCIT